MRSPSAWRDLGRYAEPAPIPMMNLPPVRSLSVPPAMAKAMGVRYITGETEIPVPRPSGTTLRLDSHRSPHNWNESWPDPSGVQILAYPNLAASRESSA